MAILLLVLKIIGIIILILLALIIIALLLILFCPVRYKISGKTEDKSFLANVSWLLKLFRVRVSYAESKLTTRISILFFGFDPTKEPTDPKKKAKKEAKKKIKEEKKQAKKEAKKSRKKKNKDDDDGEDSEEISKLDKVTDILGRVQNVLKHQSRTHVFSDIFAEIINILKTVIPNKLSGFVEFGLTDPADTGYILGGLACIPYLFCSDLRITPDFETEENFINADVTVAGKIRLISIIIPVIRLLLNKNLRKLIAILQGKKVKV